MSDSKLVWSSESGDNRKKNDKNSDAPVDENHLELKLRRLTSGKGRTVIEISGLPSNKNWCKKLSKELKKSLGVGGSYKDDKVEVHGEKMDQVMTFLEKKSLKFKKIGG